MPFFNSQNIFGVGCAIVTVTNPRGEQKNEFPGLSGVESLDQGLRGRFTNASGILIGVDLATLAGYEGIFRSFIDGTTYTLVDSFGASWINVKLITFEPQGRIKFGLATPTPTLQRGYFRHYQARFEHLT